MSVVAKIHREKRTEIPMEIPNVGQIDGSIVSCLSHPRTMNSCCHRSSWKVTAKNILRARQKKEKVS